MIDMLHGWSHSALLFSGIGGVLVLATVVAEILRWRQRGKQSAVIDNLVARIRAWWVMAAVVGLAFLGGRIGVVLLFALVSLFALREFITLTRENRWRVGEIPVQILYTDYSMSKGQSLLNGVNIVFDGFLRGRLPR